MQYFCIAKRTQERDNWEIQMKRDPNTQPTKSSFLGICGMSQQLLTALRELAKRNHRSLAGEVRSILSEHVKEAK